MHHIDEGTLGRSARGKVPLRNAEGHVVGAVSVGIAYDSVRDRFTRALPGLLAYAGGALGVGALAALLVFRRLQRRTHDVAFSDITALLAEREAVLHGIREGVSSRWTRPDGCGWSTTRRSGCSTWAGSTWGCLRTRPWAPAARPGCWQERCRGRIC